MLQRMKKIDANVNILSYKNKLIIMIAKRTGQSAIKKRFSGFLFTPLEHTAGIIERDISLIPLLSLGFEMFQIT